MTSALRTLHAVFAALAVALCAGVAGAQNAHAQNASLQSTDATFGVWRSDDGNAHIRLAPCAEQGLCGETVWIAESAVKARTNAAGLRVLGAFTRNDAGWSGGRIFLPTRGRAFRTSFTPQADGRLRVRGCALRVLCETRYWTRVE